MSWPTAKLSSRNFDSFFQLFPSAVIEAIQNYIFHLRHERIALPRVQRFYKMPFYDIMFSVGGALDILLHIIFR